MREPLLHAKMRMRRKSSVALDALLLQTELDREGIPIVVRRFVSTPFLDSLQSNLTRCFAFQNRAPQPSGR